MINYKHLHYFWVVAKEGGITRACERLHLMPQTISGQLSLLEDSLGEALFTRVGRKLDLTETGRLVLGYADEIFSLGAELEDMVSNLPDGIPQVFKVGVVDAVPKTIAYRLLAPALQLPEPVRVVCRENSIETLLTELAIRRIDLVIADGPIPASINVRGFNHKLGESDISFFASDKVKKKLKTDFPYCLDGAPLLLPGNGTLLRSGIEQWLEKHELHPRIVAEFDDSALMKAFGQKGAGIFIAPTAIAAEIEKQHHVKSIGQTSEVKENFYAISVERKVTQPVAAAVMAAARETLFAEE